MGGRVSADNERDMFEIVCWVGFFANERVGMVITGNNEEGRMGGCMCGVCLFVCLFVREIMRWCELKMQSRLCCGDEGVRKEGGNA